MYHLPWVDPQSSASTLLEAMAVAGAKTVGDQRSLMMRSATQKVDDQMLEDVYWWQRDQERGGPRGRNWYPGAG